MKTTKEQRKQKAIECLKALGIYKPYIDGFKKDNQVCFFERYGGFWAWQDEELAKKVTEIEEKYKCTVYAITHEWFHFGECYSFLIIPEDNEDWEYVIEKVAKGFYVFSYVWNKSYEQDSEFGTIGIQSFGGGIRRVG